MSLKMPASVSNTDTIRTVVLEQASQLALKDVQKPACPDAGALVKLLACGLCGSDVEKIKANKPNAVLGHELVGKIIELGKAISPSLTSRFQVGDRVALAHHIPCQLCEYCISGHPSMCLHFKSTNITPGGFSDIIALSDEHLTHTCFVLNHETSDMHATIIEPLACCIRAVDRLNDSMLRHAGPKNVLVIGLGFIGLLASFALQKRGFTVYGCDINAQRKALATDLGWVSTENNQPAMQYDAVFITACTSQTLITGQNALKDGGTLLLFSGGTFSPVLDHNQIYHRELTVMSSYSPSLLSLQEANDWVQNKLIPLEKLSSEFKSYPLDNIQNGLEDYLANKTLKAIITP